MINAASLRVTVGADVNAALKGMDRVTAAVGGFARTIGGLAISGAAALAAGLGLTARTAADFEQAMANVRSVMSPADARAYGAELSKLALTLGKETSFSAMEAAGGIEELVKAGIPLPAILGGAARSALNLAAAGGIPVAQAATLAATALNTFKRPVEDLPKIVDHLAGAANASAADIGDLQMGLAAVGPAAALVGFGFEDTASALALFSNNGLRGSDAGTSLKTMLLNLNPATKEQTALFKKLGLITKAGGNQFFDAQGKAKDLAGIADVLGKSLAGMTKQQQTATLEQLFGSDAIRAAAILAQEGSAGVRALNEEIAKVSAADVAAERLNTLQGKLEALKGSAETLAITIGSTMLQPLKDLAVVGTDALNATTTLVEGFLAETAKLAADQGISQFSAGLSLIKDEITRAFGPESAALASAFVTGLRDDLEWLKENGAKAFDWAKIKLPPGIEDLSRALNNFGRLLDTFGVSPERFLFGGVTAPVVDALGKFKDTQSAFTAPLPSLADLPAPNLFPASPTQEQNLAALAGWRERQEASAGGSTTTVTNHFTGPVTQEMIDYAIFEAAAAARADSANASDADLLVAR